MSRNEKTGDRIGKLASRAMQKPQSLSNKEVRSLGGSALTQRPDRRSGEVRRSEWEIVRNSARDFPPSTRSVVFAAAQSRPSKPITFRLVSTF